MQSYLLPGRFNCLSFARFHGLKFAFSSGLRSGTPRVEFVSRSWSSGDAAAAAADALDRRCCAQAGAVGRDNCESGRALADLETPRRLAIADAPDSERVNW